MELNRFWAKTEPFQSVLTHAFVSGSVAQYLLRDLLSEGDRRQLRANLGLSADSLSGFVGYLVSLHDIGKLEYSFQCQDAFYRDMIAGNSNLQGLFIAGVRHEKTSQSCMSALWKQQGENRASSALLSKIIGAHHQGKTGNGNFKRSSGWFELQSELEGTMRRHFLGAEGVMLPEIERLHQGPAAVLLLGLMILADWISSGSMFSDAEAWIGCPNQDIHIEEATKEFLNRSGLNPQKIIWPPAFSDVWPNIPYDGQRPLQRTVETVLHEMELPAQLVLIEAPMGEGKTEAGVYAALHMAMQWGKDGLYVALPTAATSNQMVGRIRALLDLHGLSDSVRLLHSMAWLEKAEEYRPNSPDEHDEIASWLAPVKRGLLGQYAVGTVDQAMLAATNVKYGVLRLLGLSNKALIIDEIHSYDAYMSEIIVRLLEWCKALEIPVVMLSATLPPMLKEKLLKPYASHRFSEAYPLITAIDQDGRVIEREIGQTSHRLNVQVQLTPLLGDADQIAELAVNEVADGGCICVLMNTVREVQAVYSSIKKRYHGDLLLFHAQFPAGQRAELETECISRYGKDKSHRPKQSILVATQVVEQSLDVDFDFMITAIAPIDLLLQRMGRVFRHDDSPRPASHVHAGMTVLVPKEGSGFGSSAYVYPECLLNSAIRLLKDRTHIQIPEDMAQLVREGYDPSFAPEEEARQWLENQIKEQAEAGASQQYLLNPPDKLYSALNEEFLYEDDENSYRLSAKTRLGEPTVRIALLTEEEMAQLYPFIQTKNGRQVANVWDRKTAELVMKRSVSVRIRRLDGNLSGLSDIQGAMLLSGLKILPLKDGVYRTEKGRIIRFDTALGLLIEEGVS
ncbi:MAG: CRISPR-associated helicase Cas3' [Ruminococcaceae bacterium]|nr:CRISPR-associated helicase Cas3' [Oscillospiraceae bacterium]